MDMESATQEMKKGALATGRAKWKEFAEKLKNSISEVAFRTKKLGEDDPRRITHSLKVGLALTLVSLLYYVKPLYDSFGVAGMWAVLTVVVVFEFTVGATLSKCLNRGFGTILAGGLGIGAQSLASLFGDEGEPIVLGILVFILAAAATFSRFFPKIKARYDYGVMIFILTFSLVAISGYRVDKVLELAYQRLSTILIGGATCVLVSMFVCPVWAGETLHNSVASNIEKVANYLEGFGGEYFQLLEDGDGVVGVSEKDRYFLCGYKSVLHSQSSEETLANFARWEPGHARFLFRHPWKQYLKVGKLTRSCAYKIEAISSCINSDHKVVLQFQRRIEEPCKKMSSESSKALKILASEIKTMTRQSSANSHVEKAKAAINDLKVELQAASFDIKEDLAAIAQAATVASFLVEIVKAVEELSKSVEELSRLARFEQSLPQEKSQILHRGTIKPVLDSETDDEYIVITVNDEMIKTNAPIAGIRV